MPVLSFWRFLSQPDFDRQARRHDVGAGALRSGAEPTSDKSSQQGCTQRPCRTTSNVLAQDDFRTVFLSTWGLLAHKASCRFPSDRRACIAQDSTHSGASLLQEKSNISVCNPGGQSQWLRKKLFPTAWLHNTSCNKSLTVLTVQV